MSKHLTDDARRRVRSRKRRTVVVRSALLGIVIGAGWLAAPASAAIERVAGKAHADTYMGVEAIHGVVGVCTGNGRASPTVVTPATRVYAPTSAWALNHVMNGDGSNLDDTTGAAIATIVKNDPAVPSNHKNPTPDVGVGARVNQIVAEANAYAGERSIPLALATSSVPPGLTWQLDGVGVKAPGGWLPGRLITLTIEGPVVFESTGTRSVTVTSATSPQALALRSTGHGTFTVRADTSVPSNFVNAHDAQSAGHQRITTRVGDEPLSGSTSAEAVFDYQPSAVTNTSVLTAAEVGVRVHDTLTITGAEPGSTLSGRSALFGPLATKPVQSDAAPAGTPLVGIAEFTVTTDANGAATVDTSALTLPAPGYYVWREEIDGDPETTPSPRNLGFRGPYGVGAETSLVAPPPEVVTQVNRQEVLVGQPISDTVTISGTIYDADGLGPITHQVSGRLHGPVAPVDGRCAEVDWTNAPVALEFGPLAVSATQQTLTGVGEFTPSERGCFSYAETLVSTNSQGAEIYRVDHPAGRAEQTTLVSVPEAVTQISDYVVAPGESFSDTVTVTGNAGESGTFVATLWGPVAPDPQLGCWFGTERWAGLVASGEAKPLHSETLPFTGDGDVTTSEVTVTDLGCYTWSETFTFDSAPHVELETPPGMETETGMVAQPAIATEAKADSPHLGARMHDVITLSGTQGQPGTLTADVLTAPPIDGRCDDVDWEADGTKAGEIDPIPTTADGVFTSSTTVIDGDEARCATFVAAWTPDHEKLIEAAVADRPGLPSETLLFIPRTPTVSAGIPPIASSPVLLTVGLFLIGGGACSTVWHLRRRSHRG
ncbi:hypothetical protein [Aeromicrobium alkaliterrae]|uniref:Prealbumin-like fold domain-containing protein n=1 Tax=Aeromicrobium alkaliterrae TaxID=302168 RepID=A0ABP4VGW1_9ACTN